MSSSAASGDAAAAREKMRMSWPIESSTTVSTFSAMSIAFFARLSTPRPSPRRRRAPACRACRGWPVEPQRAARVEGGGRRASLSATVCCSAEIPTPQPRKNPVSTATQHRRAPARREMREVCAEVVEQRRWRCRSPTRAAQRWRGALVRQRGRCQEHLRGAARVVHGGRRSSSVAHVIPRSNLPPARWRTPQGPCRRRVGRRRRSDAVDAPAAHRPTPALDRGVDAAIAPQRQLGPPRGVVRPAPGDRAAL